MQKQENACKTKQNQAILDGREPQQGMWETLVKPSGIKLFCMLRTRAGTLQNSLKNEKDKVFKRFIHSAHRNGGY